MNAVGDVAKHSQATRAQQVDLNQPHAFNTLQVKLRDQQAFTGQVRWN